MNFSTVTSTAYTSIHVHVKRKLRTRFSKCQAHESTKKKKETKYQEQWQNVPLLTLIERGELQQAKQIEKRKYNDSTNEAVAQLQLQGH